MVDVQVLHEYCGHTEIVQYDSVKYNMPKSADGNIYAFKLGGICSTCIQAKKDL